eukprot:TRINITY_DN68482_c0_g1_i1.p2 TRINITY_DN68482_c0_g1~~TRINITY_DN68482_c0_g1_i1.p2  ORF type:complete len:146 (-),score=0.42 TRINITY_DN68482_c0_g1_i1:424-861(-)
MYSENKLASPSFSWFLNLFSSSISVLSHSSLIPSFSIVVFAPEQGGEILQMYLIFLNNLLRRTNVSCFIILGALETLKKLKIIWMSGLQKLLMFATSDHSNNAVERVSVSQQVVFQIAGIKQIQQGSEESWVTSWTAIDKFALVP